jgi:hypothetical protein
MIERPQDVDDLVVDATGRHVLADLRLTGARLVAGACAGVRRRAQERSVKTREGPKATRIIHLPRSFSGIESSGVVGAW